MIYIEVKQLKKNRGFTLIELIVVIVILAILAAILIPIISGFIETAHQATDNANARLIYNATAMWFSDNNAADADLLPAELNDYLGLSAYPPAKSSAFKGTYSAAVTAGGVITIKTSKPATYNSEIGKLVVD
jgi:prepilin-type N-terminal cleavage/methylation domain-containing protein